MPARRLVRRKVGRIWGRRDLPPGFGSGAEAAPIGEIWFADERGEEAELLVKYLFTSDRLSVQVHPDDDAARARGHPRGKAEAWLVLDAEPDARIGIGMTQDLSPEELRAAALNGSVERLLDWRPVAAGDFLYSAGGTIHAIGAGLSLIEIQQNLDLTYRLYDYGRPRELHLDEAVAVARAEPWRPPFESYEKAQGRQVLMEGGAFVAERWTFTGPARIEDGEGQLQLIAVRAGGKLDGQAIEAASVWRVEGAVSLDTSDGIDLLAAYPGPAVREVVSF